MTELELPRPDDWHLHLRDGAALRAVLPFTAARFARAIVMPNLVPPHHHHGARARLPRAHPAPRCRAGARFEPLMTLYLTDQTSAEEIERAHASGAIFGCKLYPAGATTHSAHGVHDVARLEAALAAMAACDLPLLVHGELPDEAVDVFDREARFIESVLAPLALRHPTLRIVFEHVSTAAAVEFVQSARPGVAATITPQHLMFNRNALLAGGLRPHYYCLPVLKSETDRRATDRGARGGRSALLPRHRQRAARARGQGKRLRLRRGILGARRHRAVRGDIRGRGHAAAAGGFRLSNSAPTSIACRAIRRPSRW